MKISKFNFDKNDNLSFDDRPKINKDIKEQIYDLKNFVKDSVHKIGSISFYKQTVPLSSPSRLLTPLTNLLYNTNVSLAAATKAIKEAFINKDFDFFELLKNYEIYNTSDKPETIAKKLTVDQRKQVFLYKYGKKGTILHNMMEQTLSSQTFTINEELNKQFTNHYKAMQLFLENNKIEPLAMELHVLNVGLKYHGFIDFVGYINGKLCIADFKTTNTLHTEHISLQLVYYQMALATFDIYIDDLLIIHFDNQGEYHIVEVIKSKVKEYERRCAILAEFPGWV